MKRMYKNQYLLITGYYLSGMNAYISVLTDFINKSIQNTLILRLDTRKVVFDLN